MFTLYKFLFCKGYTKKNYKGKCKTLFFPLAFLTIYFLWTKEVFKSNTKHVVFHKTPTPEHQLPTMPRGDMCSFFALL